MLLDFDHILIDGNRQFHYDSICDKALEVLVWIVEFAHNYDHNIIMLLKTLCSSL